MKYSSKSICRLLIKESYFDLLKIEIQVPTPPPDREKTLISNKKAKLLVMIRETISTDCENRTKQTLWEKFVIS
jgi:hypothetical protein